MLTHSHTTRLTPTGGVPAGLSGETAGVFLFFSNRLGCFGSLLVSAAITLVLLLLFNVI